MSHLDELDEFEAKLELELKREYTAVFGLFRYCILTQDATYLCNKLDLKVVPQASYPFFHVQMEDVWVWDKNRPTRIIPRAEVYTSGDVTVEELRGEGDEPKLTAEALAERLGEPYGTLVLTLSVIIIEVALLAAIMLHGQNNPTLARDAMFATLMIVLNGMVGTALLMGALRYWEQEYNLAGARAFLVVIASLAVFALIIPNYTKTEPDPSQAPMKAVLFASITILFYIVFLIIQTVRHRALLCRAGAWPSHQARGRCVARRR
jgi:Protein of unknown function (DUF2469)/Sodium/calcium exchanger protein